jgi:hypothetical protein
MGKLFLPSRAYAPTLSTTGFALRCVFANFSMRIHWWRVEAYALEDKKTAFNTHAYLLCKYNTVA